MLHHQMYYQKDLTQQQRKKGLAIKNSPIYLSVFLLLSCSTLKQTNYNPITDLPKEINVRYGTDVISKEESALKIAEILFIEDSPNTNFDVYKPFKIQLIADGKVWDIEASTQEKNFKGIRKTYHIRINKNTAEVLNFWVER